MYQYFKDVAAFKLLFTLKYPLPTLKFNQFHAGYFEKFIKLN